MAFNDGIPRINCYSLTDLHDFDFCQFRFYVNHHLLKKYELEEGNYYMALGTLLDETIKLFHKSKAYGQPPEYVGNLISACSAKMKERVATQKGPSFYSAILKFVTDDLCKEATSIFINYYQGLNKKIKPSLGEVGFCEWVLKDEEGNKFKLWGGPDAFEMGEDGIPEVCDYKFRSDLERGKENMDMELMPKIYMLLSCQKLLDWGYKKARFIVRFWQDPTENGFYEEFDLEKVVEHEEIFKKRIVKIIKNTLIDFCGKPFCSACNSKDKEQFLLELQKLGLYVSTDLGKGKGDMVLETF